MSFYILFIPSALCFGLAFIFWYMSRVRSKTNVGVKVIPVYPLRECPDCHEMKSFPDHGEGPDVPSRCYDCFVAACKDMDAK